MRIRFVAPARAELRQAKHFYDSVRMGLGQQFVSEVFATINRISERPFAWPLAEDGIRKIMTHRFPYLILFRPAAGLVLIVSVKHMRRGPDELGRKIQDLD